MEKCHLCGVAVEAVAHWDEGPRRVYCEPCAGCRAPDPGAWDERCDACHLAATRG